MTRVDAETLLRAARARSPGDDDRRQRGDRAAEAPASIRSSPTRAGPSADFFAMFRRAVPRRCGVERGRRRQGRARRRDRAPARREAVRHDRRRRPDDPLEGTRLRIVGVIDTWRADAALLRPQHRRLRPAASRSSCRSRRRASSSSAAAASMNCWDEHRGRRGARRAVRVDPVLGRARQRGEGRPRTATTSCATPRSRRPPGGYERPPNVRLRNVMEWLDVQGGRAHRRAPPDLGRARLSARLPDQHGRPAARRSSCAARRRSACGARSARRSARSSRSSSSRPA